MAWTLFQKNTINFLAFTISFFPVKNSRTVNLKLQLLPKIYFLLLLTYTKRITSPGEASLMQLPKDIIADT